MRSLEIHFNKLDRFYRGIVIALTFMSPVFLIAYLFAEHCIWICWFMGLFFCLVDAHGILYADEGFRWAMSWRVRHPEQAKPSQHELDKREIKAVFGLLCSLAAFLAGLLVQLS